MNIFIADNAGACYGVNRSLDIVKEASQENLNVATLGDLIHNPIVVKNLKNKYNIGSVDSVESAKNININNLVIRSHGVPIDLIKKAKEFNIKILDATCPHVKHVQDTAKYLALLYPAVIIIGKSGHPEIESVSSYVLSNGTKCFVGQTIKELNNYIPQLKKLNSKIGVVSQTTQSLNVFNKMINYLQEQGIKLDIKNTICSATKQRQKSAIELSKRVDAIIVLGGKNSSNTNHLADLCKENCNIVIHIEQPDELDLTQLQNVKNLGITAGASTPKSQIDSLVNYLNQLL